MRVPSSGLSSKLIKIRKGFRSCISVLSSPCPLTCKIPTIAYKKHTQIRKSRRKEQLQKAGNYENMQKGELLTVEETLFSYLPAAHSPYLGIPLIVDHILFHRSGTYSNICRKVGNTQYSSINRCLLKIS